MVCSEFDDRVLGGGTAWKTVTLTPATFWGWDVAGKGLAGADAPPLPSISESKAKRQMSGYAEANVLSEAKAHQRRAGTSARLSKKVEAVEAPDVAKRSRHVPWGTAAEQRGG